MTPSTQSWLNGDFSVQYPLFTELEKPVVRDFDPANQERIQEWSGIGDYPRRPVLFRTLSAHQRHVDDRSVSIALFGWAAWPASDNQGSTPGESMHLGTLARTLEQSDPAQLFPRLRGDFCVAYLTTEQERTKHLYVYRSLTCSYPLYYVVADGVLHCATRPALLLPHRVTLDDIIDLDVLSAIATGGQVPPGDSCFRGLRRLRGGSLLTATRDRWAVRTIDDFRIHPDCSNESLDAIGERLRGALAGSTVRQAVPEDRTAILLSGGLDSAVTCYEWRKHSPDLHAFHLVRPEIDALRDEPTIAAAIAAQLDVGITELDARPLFDAESLRIPANLGAQYPYSHVPSLVPLWRLGKHLLEQKFCVLVGGFLADNLFEGDWRYDHVRALGVRKSRPWTYPRAVWALLGNNVSVSLAECMTVVHRAATSHPEPSVSPDVRRLDVIGPWISRAARRQAASTAEARWASFPSLEGVAPGTRKVYRSVVTTLESERGAGFYADFANITGVRIASPFSDREVIELCLSLSPHHRYQIDRGLVVSKLALRAAYRQELPLVASRAAHALQGSVAQRYAHEAAPLLTSLLGEDSILSDLGITDPIGLRTTLENPRTFRQNAPFFMFAAGVELWLRNFTARAPGERCEVHRG